MFEIRPQHIIELRTEEPTVLTSGMLDDFISELRDQPARREIRFPTFSYGYSNSGDTTASMWHQFDTSDTISKKPEPKPVSMIGFS